MNNDTNHIAQALAAAGIRPSAQRIAVMRYLTTHFTHPTVDDIYQELIHEYPTISRTTIYNTLKVLVQSGTVMALGIDPANLRYDAAMHPHAHFMCDCCGAIEDIPLDHWPPAPGDIRIHRTQVSYHGICSKCQQ